MIKHMLFSDCLRTLLSISGISINRLSRAITIDNSLVNRWVNGKRIPPYNTLYIEQISEYICKHIKNSFQEKQIDELFFTMDKPEDIGYSLEKKIEIILLEAQGYSIKNKKKRTYYGS
ncbi:hypothetical protein CS063_14235 [Sporanaerobium hydrogeniformans]|uniref:Uncharacterized protein n=1 Tax=Sporanaerobium hydrogeniformans TaxID=3072179 RepID=A0AC61D945_9FIRM|nr:helix-turn-helix transcriptional regulator [Sporanaerobium hydrogeniformans]PHV69749.1 hypothetical protein CS063_14235 [Sporanaerobium hydrogeniformans]